MSVQECYEKIGGDYDAVIKLLRNDTVILKCLKLFLQDESYKQFTVAVHNNRIDEAFKTAHTLKGVCLNLRLTPLANTVSEIVEILRVGNWPDKKQLSDLENEYERVVWIISEER